MPTCDVYVYDHTLAPVSSMTIEITETDEFCTNIDWKIATTLGPAEFGAQITLPSPPTPIDIWVDDTSGVFAPASLAQLNGKLTARLDVILYVLPVTAGGSGGSGGGGRGKVASRQIWTDILTPHIGIDAFPFFERSPTRKTAWPVDFTAAYINYRVESNDWSNSEAAGVRSLVDTATRALNYPKLNSHMRKKLERWCVRLDELGIIISPPVNYTKQGGGQNQGGKQGPPVLPAAL